MFGDLARRLHIGVGQGKVRPDGPRPDGFFPRDGQINPSAGQFFRDQSPEARLQFQMDGPIKPGSRNESRGVQT